MSDQPNPVAARFYPSMSATPAPEPAPAVPAPAPAPAPAAGEETAAERLYRKEPREAAWFEGPAHASRRDEPAAEPEADRIARNLYGNSVTTRNAVDWDEASEGRADFDQIPGNVEVDRGEYDARLPVVREALIEAGVGPSLARELHGSVMRAAADPFRGTAEQGLEQLRRQWGPEFDARLQAAQAMVVAACRKAPELRGILERTGLGNDPRLVTKLAKRAEALSRKGGR